MPDGSEAFEGQARLEAGQALTLSGELLDNPIERGLILRALRIAEARPRAQGLRGWMGVECRNDWMIDLYTYFWIRYGTLAIACDRMSRL